MIYLLVQHLLAHAEISGGTQAYLSFKAKYKKRQLLIFSEIFMLLFLCSAREKRKRSLMCCATQVSKKNWL